MKTNKRTNNTPNKAIRLYLVLVSIYLFISSILFAALFISSMFGNVVAGYVAISPTTAYFMLPAIILSVIHLISLPLLLHYGKLGNEKKLVKLILIVGIIPLLAGVWYGKGLYDLQKSNREEAAQFNELTLDNAKQLIKDCKVDSINYRNDFTDYENPERSDTGLLSYEYPGTPGQYKLFVTGPATDSVIQAAQNAQLKKSCLIQFVHDNSIDARMSSDFSGKINYKRVQTKYGFSVELPDDFIMTKNQILNRSQQDGVDEFLTEFHDKPNHLSISVGLLRNTGSLENTISQNTADKHFACGSSPEIDENAPVILGKITWKECTGIDGMSGTLYSWINGRAVIIRTVVLDQNTDYTSVSSDLSYHIAESLKFSK